MLIDGRSLSDGDQIDTDIAIIGAGPAGMTVALRIGEGTRVCLLESGGVDVEAEAQALLGGTSIGYPYHALDRTRVRAVGGTSRHWPLTTTGGDEGWIARPFDAIDFEARPGVRASGWPITRSDLDPWYERAASISEIEPIPWEGDGWPPASSTARPAPIDLGPTVVSHVFQRATTSFLRLLPTLERSSSITLFHHSTVVRIVPDGERRVAALRVTGRSGSTFTVVPKIVVLAAGGIDNPRTLLLAQRQTGVAFGNAHDHVGRYFMERLSARTGVVTPAGRLATEPGFYLSHLVGPTRIHGTLSISDATLRQEGLLNGTYFLIPRSRAFASEGGRSLITLRRGLQRRPWIGGAAGHLRNIARDAGQLARLPAERLLPLARGTEVLLVGAQAEQAPNPASRITLGDHLDPLGQPEPVVDWRLSPIDTWSVRRSQEILDLALRRAGAGRLDRPLGSETPPALFIAAFHHMGTTRMSARPEDGVVDPDGRVHGMDNLYVTGSSVFPTSGFANPTFTIVALAARLAGHLSDVAQSVPSVVAPRRAPRPVG